MKEELIDKVLNREIDIIENDDSLTPEEKAKENYELEQEVREYMRDSFEE